jgi:hypothetical protein
MNAADMLRAAPFAGDVQKRRNAETILAEFQAARWPAGLALAAIANAVAESNLNEFATGDGGHSIGLFQINDLRGQLTFDFDRRDPEANTRQQAYQRGASVPEMAALFAAIVERPADIPGEMAKREALTRNLFPEAAIRRASAVKYGGADVLLPARTDVDPLSAAYWWGVAGAVALLAGAIVWRRFRS